MESRPEARSVPRTMRAGLQASPKDAELCSDTGSFLPAAVEPAVLQGGHGRGRAELTITAAPTNAKSSRFRNDFLDDSNLGAITCPETALWIYPQITGLL